jgi:hypothetical protein
MNDVLLHSRAGTRMGGISSLLQQVTPHSGPLH